MTNETIRAELDRNAAWQVTVGGRQWLCPYCGDVGGPWDPEPDARLAVASRHIAACADADGGAGAVLDVESLKARASSYVLLDRVRSDPRWRVIDSRGVWYCPFCAMPTRARLADKGRLTVEVGTRILGHLAKCERSRGQDLSRARLAEICRNLVDKDQWRFYTELHLWICPFCLARTPARIGPEGQMTPELLEAVNAHLAGCRRFEERLEEPEPLGRIGAAQGAANRLEKETSTPAASETSADAMARFEDSQVLKAITAEIAQLRTSVALKDEVEKGLDEARKRQLQMLPAMPAVEGYEFVARFQPSSQVGGDFYDFIQVSEGRIGVAIGDVSGHGVEAAIVMGMAKKLLGISGRGRSSPAEVLRIANADIRPDLDGQTFVTVGYGVLETRARVFRFARAGHHPLVVFNPARDPATTFVKPRGIALGMTPPERFDPTLEEETVLLRPGDLLVQYTDGVTEAKDAAGEEFGLARLLEAVARGADHEAEYVAYQIETALERFRGGAPQEDDITLLLMRLA